VNPEIVRLLRNPRTAAAAGVAIRLLVSQLDRNGRGVPGLARLGDLLMREAGVDDEMMTLPERRRRQLAAASRRYRERKAGFSVPRLRRGPRPMERAS
jgi:hypothetical protein